jgi:hypothetical protein
LKWRGWDLLKKRRGRRRNVFGLFYERRIATESGFLARYSIVLITVEIVRFFTVVISR